MERPNGKYSDEYVLWSFLAGIAYGNKTAINKITTEVPLECSPATIGRMIHAIDTGTTDVYAWCSEHDIEFGDGRSLMQSVCKKLRDNHIRQKMRAIAAKVEFTQLQSPHEYATKLKAALTELEECGIKPAE